MQRWQIKALELEVSVLKHLDGFVHEQVAMIRLMLARFARD